MNKARILIVDDNIHVRRGVHCILECRGGWEVCGEAATGLEAVELAKRLQPDIVLMDISMPGMSGLEATRHIRDIAPRSKVIILSIHESDHVVHKAREAGAQGYVFKSDLDRDLLNTVELVAENQSFYPPNSSKPVASSGPKETGAATGKTEAKKSSDAPLASPGDRGGRARAAKAGRTKKVPQQNSWVHSGSGKSPRVW
jgi:DNA-binding NarL/FixJ family response regulator